MGSFSDNGVNIHINGQEIDRQVFLSLEPDYQVPPGVDRIEYVQGERYSEFSAGRQTGHSDPWPEGDTYISRLADYLAAMQSAAPQPASQRTIDPQPVHDFEATLPTIDVSVLTGRDYPHLVIAPRKSLLDLRTIGIEVLDIRNQASAGGALTSMQQLFDEADGHGIPVIGVVSTYGGTDQSSYIATLESMGCTVIGELEEGTYVCRLPGTDLASRQRQKKNEIRRASEQALAAGYLTSAGITMDADPEHVRLLDDGYRLAVRLNQTTMDIRDYNNQVHMAVPIADVETMVTELALNVQAQLAKKWALEQQIDTATTVAEVDAVAWS